MSYFMQLPNLGGGGGTTVVESNTYIDFQVDAGVKNGVVKASYDGGAPSLEFPSGNVGYGITRYSLSIPSDFNDAYGSQITLYWSPSDSTTGNCHWQLGYTTLTSGVTLVNAPLTNIDYLQPAPGVAKILTDTGNNLALDSMSLSAKDLIWINVLRVNDANDTYSGTARLHCVRFWYNIQT